MKLPTSLTTVTKFSKFIALILFVTLPFIGFFFGMEYQQKLDGVPEVSNPVQYSNPSPTPTPKPTLSTGESTALNDEDNLLWEVPTKTVPVADEVSMKAEIKRLSPLTTGQLATSYLAVTNVKIDSNWAVLTVVVKDRANKKVLPTDGIEYYGYKDGLSWHIYSNTDKSLCRLLKQQPDPIPASLVSAEMLTRYGCR